MEAEGFSFCLCADDFALSPGVSRGILMALAAGRLTATSVMTTQLSWPRDSGELHAYEDVADIGLHLNLTLGTPLSSMPRFAPSKAFPSVRTVISLAQRGILPETEIRAEIGAQIDAFIEHFGRAPDFIDGHQHVHVLPAIRPWLFSALESRALSGRLWLRDSGDRLHPLLRRRVQMKKALAVNWLARGFARAAAARGFQTNQGFAGFSSFGGRGTYASDFERYLVAPGQQHLIMCHPGLVDDELARLDPVTGAREEELTFLLSPGFQDCLDRKGARLSRLSRV